MSSIPTDTLLADTDFDEDVDDDAPFLQVRSPNHDDEFDITPMIDIVFLLLIFFLVSTKIDPEQAVDLPKARHGNVVAAEDSIVILMKRGTGDQAEVANAAGVLFSRDIEQQNAELTEYVQTGFDEGKQRVILRAAGDVRQGEVGRVSEAIGQSLGEGELINIAVMEQN